MLKLMPRGVCGLGVLVAALPVPAVTPTVEVPGVRAIQVLHPDSPTRTEMFAAAELAAYLERIRGKPVTVRSEAAPDEAAYPIFVGRSAASEPFAGQLGHAIADIQADSFLAAVDSERTVLVGGGDRGTLYAVYDLLERQGCRWYEPGPPGEIVPRRSSIRLSSGTRVERPAFAVREIGMGSGASEEETLAVIDWCVKNRLNRLYNARPGVVERRLGEGNRDAWAKRGGNVRWQHICHNSPWMVPNETYFDSHPEYFSLYQGKRIPAGKEAGYLCTTHPGVEQAIVDFALDWFGRHPEGSVLPICPPDGAVKWCECEVCSALGGVNFADGPAGHMTRRQVDLINRVARRVRETYPDRYILHLAYSRYVWPYAGVRLEPNTIAQVCHGYAGNGCYVHPITAPCNREAREVFQTWSAAGTGGIGIWDYFILQVEERSGSPLTPLGFGKTAHAMIGFLAGLPNPYKVYFTQAGNELQKSNPFVYWLITRLAWDPGQSLEALREDYCRGTLGPAWKPGAAYLAALDDVYDRADWHPDIWRHIAVPSPRVFTPEFVAAANHQLARVRDALPGDAARGHDALARMQRSLDYAEQSVLPKRLIASGDGVWRLQRGEEAYVFNADARRSNDAEVEALRRRARERGLLDDGMQRVLFRTRARAEKLAWLENERIRVGVLPGVGGRVLRLINTRSGRNLLYEPMAIDRLEDPGVGYFRYGGYEEYTGSAFASPGWEIPMSHTVTRGPASTSLILKGRVNGLDVKRVIAIPAGDSAEVRITTTLTNITAEPRKARIRVHPEFKIGEKLDDVVLFTLGADGATDRQPIRSVSSMADHDVRGMWGARHRDEPYGILNTFPPEGAELHLHLDPEAQSFNLELFGNEKVVAPGDSLTLEHAYRLLEGREEVEKWIPEEHSTAP